MTARDFVVWRRHISRSKYSNSWIIEKRILEVEREVAFRKKVLARASELTQEMVARGLVSFPDQEGNKTELGAKPNE